ncbi:MAG: LuxR C-terminal-related transcriptional regulator [Actinomycetota bacterium]
MGDLPHHPPETDVDRLRADDLDELADQWFWRDDPDASMRWRREAYRRHVRDGDDDRSSRAAWRLFYDHFLVGETAPAGGWLERCREHADRAGDVAAGWLAIADADWADRGDDPLGRRRRSSDAVEIARAVGDRDLLAMALQSHGRALIAAGEGRDGRRLLDEAMVAVVNDELDPLYTGWVFCNVVSTCFELADLRRAQQWSDAAVRWCDGGDVGRMYPGLCRVYAVELDALRGSWESARAGVTRACADLHAYDPRYAASAHEVAGDLALRRGDLDGADDEYRRCRELGGAPHRGLALLRAARGDVAVALAELRALAEARSAPFPDAMLLLAMSDLAAEIGDASAVRLAAERLATLAADHPSELVDALALAVRGELALMEGDLVAALHDLVESTSRLTEHDVRHEAARRRVRAADVSARLGDHAHAVVELDAAIAVFDDLGAEPDGVRARSHRALLLDGGDPSPSPESSAGPLSRRELDVLELVASGHTNRQVADRLVISTHTVDRHMSNIRSKLGVSSRAAAIALAYEHGWLDGAAPASSNG